MNPLAHALKTSAERLWRKARRVEKSDPENARALKSLAKSDAKLADEIANKQRTSRKELC